VVLFAGLTSSVQAPTSVHPAPTVIRIPLSAVITSQVDCLASVLSLFCFFDDILHAYNLQRFICSFVWKSGGGSHRQIWNFHVSASMRRYVEFRHMCSLGVLMRHETVKLWLARLKLGGALPFSPTGASRHTYIHIWACMYIFVINTRPACP
jgi:hypothetical protein